jgi:transposase-like protein
MTQVLRRYSIAFKRAVVAEVEAGQYTAVEAAKVHGVNYVSVYKWLKEHGGPSSQTRIVRVEMPDERTGLKELEKRNRELERALANAQIKIMTLEASLEILEERTGQRIKKKTDSPSSSGSEEKPTT